MTPEKLGKTAVEALKKIYPEGVCSLEGGGDPFRLLVMACLSAQCTDARVNAVSVGLFEKYPNAAAMSQVPVGEIEDAIRSCGLYKTKAKNIKELSRIITEEFGGKVPDTMEGLLRLPGVGRKVANLILGDVYGKPGIVADTHCIRICGRLGFYGEDEKNPLRVERILTPLIEASEQSGFCHRLVLFGREYCSARNPRCEVCPICGFCRRAQVKTYENQSPGMKE